MDQVTLLATKTQDVGFLGCLLMALILVLTQAWVSIKPSTPMSEEAKKALKDAAQQVSEAADASQEAADAVADVHTQLTAGNGEPEALAAPELIQASATKVKGAKDKAADAKHKAATAKDKAEKATGLEDLVNTVAAKLPLLGGALVFVLLGAWVAGFAKVTLGG